MHIVEGGLDDPRVIALLHAHLTRARAETAPGSAHALDLSGLRAPNVTFWSAWDGEGDVATLVGVGALVALSAEHGEVKSMHTAEAWRGRGIGGALLRHIVAAARARGMTRLSLETGSWPYFAPARALYARHGFVECPPFGDYRPDPNSVFMTLAPLDAPRAPWAHPLPTRARSAFLTAEWRYLVMVNYEVAPTVLRPLVPAGTALDLWDGRALVSVVGFRFLATRLLGAAIPFHRDFDEVNLRFYVRRELPGGEVRRGVVFVRELVPRLAIALVARLAYNEPYRAVPMRHTAPAAPTDAPGRIAYEWRTDGRWQHVAATAVGAPRVPAPGTEAAFVTEHYWGYTRQRDGGTVEYAVAHPPWRVWAAEAPALTADVAGLYGPGFVSALGAPPVSAFVAEGSPVTVFRPARLGARGVRRAPSELGRVGGRHAAARVTRAR